MKNNTFYTYSFGCRVNQAEKETIDREMQDQGFSLEKNLPSLAIINTCAVTHKAEREAKQLIYRLKKENPNGKIIVTGCSATYWKKNDLLGNLPVDIIVDNINKEFLVKILQKRLSGQAKSNLRGWFSGGKDNLKTNIFDKYLSSGRALIKIQDGCQRFCSFCIVPYLRGTPKSYKISDIIGQINQLEGLKEVILTAINTEAFGFDTGETLARLITVVLERTSIPRISFGSIHPWSLNDDLINLYRKVLPQQRIVNFFHVPIQSGSDKILNLMKRGYKSGEILEKLNQLHKINPLSLIATDVIVGFLEESEKDFSDTFEFLKKSPISKFHIFRFSKRINTAAYYLAKNLKEPAHKQKIERAKVLARLGKIKYMSFLEKNIGRFSRSLFIGKKLNGFQEAAMDNQLPVFVKTEKNLNGQLKNIKIVGFKKGQLFGRIV